MRGRPQPATLNNGRPGGLPHKKRRRFDDRFENHRGPCRDSGRVHPGPRCAGRLRRVGQAGESGLPPATVTSPRRSSGWSRDTSSAPGGVQAIDSVEIRACVSGYLKTISFQPGREVNKGDPLFTIDKEPFEADLAKAKANLEIAEADLKAAEAESIRAEAKLVTTKKTYDREEDSFKKGVGSEQARDLSKGAYDESNATALDREGQNQTLQWEDCGEQGEHPHRGPQPRLLHDNGAHQRASSATGW